MTATSLVRAMLPSTPFTRTFIFLTKLAWKSRVTLPMIVAAAFMAMDFRMQVEINVHTEGIMFQVTLKPRLRSYLSHQLTLNYLSRFSQDDEADDQHHHHHQDDELTLSDSQESWQTIDDDDEDSGAEEYEEYEIDDNV